MKKSSISEKGQAPMKKKRDTVGQPRKKGQNVRWSKAVEDFIAESVSEGISVKELCRRFPDKVPAQNTINKRSKNYEEYPRFAKMMDEAYMSFVMTQIDELDELSSKLASELYPDVDFKEAAEAIKRRQDALKFIIGNASAKLSKRFETKSTLEITADKPMFNIIQYTQPQEQLKEINTSYLIDEQKDPSL